MHESLEIKRSHYDKEATISVIEHNNLYYIGLPILNLSDTAITNPIMFRLSQSSIKEQFIHQKFDHRSLDVVLKMQKNNFMPGMPSTI